MRKVWMGIVVIVLILGMAVIAANAAPMTVEGQVMSTTEATDRNGNPYVRAILEEKGSVDGVQFTIGIPVMFFGSHADAGRALKAGDIIKFVGDERFFQGRKSYTFLQMVE